MNILFYKKDKKALSPIISSILLLVIGVILVVIILSWGKDFTNKSTSTISNIYKKSNSDFVVAKSTGVPQNYNTLLVKNISPQATNENQEYPEYVKYKILDPTTRYHMINNDEYEIDPPLTLPPGQEIPFNLFCTPSSKFNVQLISKDNTYTDITYHNPNYNPISCAIREVSLGSNYACAVINNGKVKCWGRNQAGQVGDGTQQNIKYAPVEAIGVSNAISVSSGGAHTCVVLESGTVKCWGYNKYGQLGNDSNIPIFSSIPVDVIGINNAISVSAGNNHTCVILEDSTVKCWGRNDFGQLGDGTQENKSTPVDVDISDVVAISSSGEAYHTCALLNGGNIKCWGDNGYGQLGVDDNNYRLIPVDVLGIDNAVSVSVGYYHTCAVLDTGSVRCWGRNNYGQLGDNTQEDIFTPVDVDISNVVAISSGDYHNCVLLDTGNVKCWGHNNYGQLGDNTQEDKHIPVDADISNVISIYSGGDVHSHTCAVLESGVVKCWGSNYYGQLGIGTSGGGENPLFL